MFTKTSAAIFMLIVTVNSASTTECIFDLVNNATEKNQPLPLFNSSSDYELVVPHKGQIHLQSGQNISLLCSGNRNYVRQTNSNVTTVKCVKNDQVELYRKVYKFEDIQCKHIVKGGVRATHHTCGHHGGMVYQIGYPVTRRDWLTLISICYVPETGNVLYTKHTLHGKEVKYASKSKYRPNFSNEGQHVNITSSVAYKQAYQKATFSSILGSSVLAGEYVNTKSYLARGHLSPDADFLLASTQFSTYYYINAAPQWQVINTASWKSVEFTIRDLSAFYGDLNVITGTYDILSYNDINENPQKIFLGTNGILPVPKYFWKIAFDSKTAKAMVFITLNDPFVKSVQQEVFCKDICVEHGYNKRSWKDPTTGYTFCCSFHDFHKVVKNVPAQIDVSGILSEPQYYNSYYLDRDIKLELE